MCIHNHAHGRSRRDGSMWFIDRQVIDFVAYDESKKPKKKEVVVKKEIVKKKIAKKPKKKEVIDKTKIVRTKKMIRLELIKKAKEAFEIAKIEVGKMEDKVRERVKLE
jgi:hypothetical protein